MWLVIFAAAPLVGEPDDRALRDLAVRAQDRTTWPALLSLAEGQTDAEQRGRAFFVLGYREYEANEFKPAAAHLKAATESGFSLTDHARYYGASAARDAGEIGQAVELLNEFSSRHPQSTLRLDALKLFAELLVDIKQPDRALKALLQEPQLREKPELMMELAEAHRAAGSALDAVRAFQETYCKFPLDAEADEARAALEELRKELAAKFPEAPDELATARAEVYARNSRWRDALDEYTGLLESRPESALAPRWRLGRARALLRTRKTDQALELLRTGIAAAPETDPERLELLVDALIRKADLEGAKKALSQLRQAHPQSSSYAEALDAFGNYYVRRGEWKIAAKYYQPLAEKFPSTSEGVEAHWRRTWNLYLEGDLTRARAGFAEHVARYPESSHVTGALYWLGRVDEQRGSMEEARAWYTFLQKRFIHSYYTDKSRPRLEDLEKSAPLQPAAATVPAAFRAITRKIPRRPAPSLRSCGRAVWSDLLQPYLTLRRLGLAELAEQYLSARAEDGADSTALRFTLSRLRAERGSNWLALFDARRSVPRYTEYQFGELPEEFWRLLYPQDYLPLVERYAQETTLDPHLVLGLIRQESAFNANAVSVAGARGLMQIMPSTASPARKGRAHIARRLFEPEYNVKFGTAHLRGRLSELDEIPEQALAAYHAGEGRVKQWRSHYNFQEPAEFLETIPIPSTRVYVEAVLRDAGIYRQLLSGSAGFAKCK